MSFARYPEYKDSGVEWLGDVPAHWTVCGTGHRLQSSPCYGVLVPDFDPDGVPMLKIMDLANGTPDRSALATISESLSNEFQRTIVRPGDVVLSVVGTIGTVLVVPEALDGINLSRALARLLPNRDLLPQWLVWIFSSENFVRFVDLVCVGSAQRVLNMDDLRSFRAPFPPIEEQTSIATFLDHETTKIDALVAEQEKLIALLREKRQAVISHAVTRGLSPNVPMKDSGVEWLGEVPAHWEVLALKRLIEVGSTISYGIVQPGEPQDEGVPFIQTTNMSSGRFDLLELQKTTEAIAHQYPRSRLSGGEVILGIRASIGAAFVVMKELAGVNLSRGVARIQCASCLEAAYLVQFLMGHAVETYWQLSKQGSTFNEVSIETVRELVVAVPPIEEQEAISAYLMREAVKFDELVSEAGSGIALLQERRTALISAAVTGQIDVRGWVQG